jgi:hypothetical protein
MQKETGMGTGRDGVNLLFHHGEHGACLPAGRDHGEHGDNGKEFGTQTSAD